MSTSQITLFQYTGTALPTGVTTVVLFSTVTAFGGHRDVIERVGMHRFSLSLKNDQAGTLKAYQSQDGGTTWSQVEADSAVAAAAAGADNRRDYVIEAYRDWKLEWTNGGVDQGTFIVNLAGIHARAPATFNTTLAATVGSLTVTSLGTGVVHSSSTGVFSSSLVVNADVSATAAIDGTKISPNFGAQTVTTTGTAHGDVVTAGASGIPATGAIRMGPNAAFLVGISTGSIDMPLIGSNSSNRVVVGSTSFGTVLGGDDFTFLRADRVTFGGGSPFDRLEINATKFRFFAASASARVYQDDLATAATTAATMTINAQDHIGTGATVAGKLLMRGGNSLNGTGGDIEVRPGTGPTATGELYLSAADATKRVRVNATGLAFFAVAPVAQPADQVAFTDNTAGTAARTLAALPDPADSPASADALRDDLVTNVLPVLRNWAASLADGYNDVRANVLRPLGLTA